MNAKKSYRERRGGEVSGRKAQRKGERILVDASQRATVMSNSQGGTDKTDGGVPEIEPNRVHTRPQGDAVDERENRAGRDGLKGKGPLRGGGEYVVSGFQGLTGREGRRCSRGPSRWSVSQDDPVGNDSAQNSGLFAWPSDLEKRAQTVRIVRRQRKKRLQMRGGTDAQIVIVSCQIRGTKSCFSGGLFQLLSVSSKIKGRQRWGGRGDRRTKVDRGEGGRSFAWKMFNGLPLAKTGGGSHR